MALLAQVSDAYWGQVERGFQRSKAGVRIIKPSRGKLIEMAEVLRLTTSQTNELLTAAEYPPLAGARDTRAGHEDYVDLTGLGRRDVRLLAALADRLREGVAEEPAPLRVAARTMQSRGKALRAAQDADAERPDR